MNQAAIGQVACGFIYRSAGNLQVELSAFVPTLEACLDRSPAMLAELHRRHPELPVVLGDGHTLPFRDGAVDERSLLRSLRDLVRTAAGRRLTGLRWASTLFPDGLWA